MRDLSRREFLKTTAAAAGTLAGGATAIPAFAAKRSATDLVPLGKTGIKVTRLAFGTGTFGGKIQRELGQEEFTRLVRHAYDRGIRFFETAQTYGGMHTMLGTALKGIPRDSYRLMTKMRWRNTEDPAAFIEQFRKELNTDYFDILLIHCVRTVGWADELKMMRDVYSEAKEKKVILAHGASCHGLLPLRSFPGNKWLDVALMRVNHDGTKMDRIEGESNLPGDVDEVISHVRKIHEQGAGVLGMKLAGEGQFTTRERRRAALQFVTKLGVVDAVTIGYKSTAEVDEAIDNLNEALNA